MYCKRCGNLLNNGENFCPKCGESKEENKNYNDNEEKENKKSVAPIIIIIIVLIIIIGISAAIFFGIKSFIKSNVIDNKNIENIIKENISDFNIDIDNSKDKDDKDESNDTITFDNYEVTKLSGYNYTSLGSSLTISSSKFSCLVTVIKSSGESLKVLIDNMDTIENTFKSSGMTVNKIEPKTYGDNEYLMVDVTYLNQDMVTFYTQVDTNNYLYGVVTFTKDKDESVMNEINKIFNNIKYIEK